jgi:hypothetical protein
MTTFAKITVLLVALIAYAFTATNAYADNRPAQMFEHRNISGKATHTDKVWTVKHSDKVSCDMTGAPELSYYMDGDTPEATAYSDYLSDLAWFIEENCK